MPSRRPGRLPGVHDLEVRFLHKLLVAICAKLLYTYLIVQGGLHLLSNRTNMTENIPTGALTFLFNHIEGSAQAPPWPSLAKHPVGANPHGILWIIILTAVADLGRVPGRAGGARVGLFSVLST